MQPHGRQPAPRRSRAGALWSGHGTQEGDRERSGQEAQRDVTAVTVPRQQRATRPTRVFVGLAVGVAVAALTLRLALLGRQSYWIDELYSVNQSAGSLRQLLDVGSTEVHPPLYAVLLWGWMKIGGTSEAWTRLLSTLLTTAAVLVTYAGMRHLDLGRHVRWALTTATAAGGAWVVYSLETRNYALLLLGATGLTVTTVRAGALVLRGLQPPARLLAPWFGWTLLAASAHPFGAVLSAGAVMVLVGVAVWCRAGRTVRTATSWGGTALAGWIPLTVWTWRGIRQPEFAAGTTWIGAPDGRDVWEVATTAFASGGMSPHRDGFAWTSPLGVLAAALLVGAAVVVHRRTATRPDVGALPVDRPVDLGAAAGILLALAVVVTASAFAVAQVWHAWTLRNMLVVVPALTWGGICLAAALSGSASGARWTSTAAIVLLAASLVPTATGIARPYKTDFRGLLEYLVTVQQQEPGTRVVVLGYGMAQRFWPATDRPFRDPGRAAVTGWMWAYPGTSLDVEPLAARPVVVVLYRDVAHAQDDAWAAATVQRLGPAGCRSVPLHGFGVVRCD